MKLRHYFSFVALALLIALPAHAQLTDADELNPFDPQVERYLEEFDKAYEDQTGEPSHLDSFIDELFVPSCFRATCHVWARVSKSAQRLELYIDGNLSNSWRVSTGKKGFTTPDFDTHPNGRIYNHYTSRAYPEGDYHGLGNMPYAVFIHGGFALHGTPEENWPHLGHPASHGCIRQHPSDALLFNRLVRAAGVRNVWITVE